MRSLALAWLALAMVTATPAAADWQYTKWGMTPEQVTAESGGKAVETTAEEQKGNAHPAGVKSDVHLKAPFESGRFQFVAFFYFSAPGGRLVGVHLNLKNAELGAELLASLRKKYGKPDIDHNRDVTPALLNYRVVWRAGSDLITYFGLPPKMFSVRYDPLITTDNEGL
jgi:hypothetical protein